VMRATSLIICDLDGTLYHTETSFLPTMHRIYAEFGIAAPPDWETLALVGETFEGVLDWVIGLGIAEDREILARRITSAEFASIAQNGRLYPGVPETLCELRDRGAALAICTNGDQDYTRTILRTFGIETLFDAVRTHEDAKRTKTEMIAALLEEFDPRCPFVVGDRRHDVEAGRANGCIVIGAVYGYARAGELDGADVRIKEFSELRGLIDGDDGAFRPPVGSIGDRSS